MRGGELRIEVKDSSGAAIAAAGWVEGAATGVRRAFRCDARGRVTVDSLASGNYRLHIAQDGFATHTASLTLADGASLTHAGLVRTLGQIAAPVRVAADRDLETSGALNLADFLNRRLANVFLNEMRSNPMQPGLNYRGFTASPLLGTPQGVSIYVGLGRMASTILSVGARRSSPGCRA